TLSNPTGTTTFDGGDTVVYDIVVSNTSGTNVTDAFDLNITDALNANLSLDNVQLVGTITGTPTDNSTGTTVDVDIDQLAPGESLTIRLTTTVQATVIDGQTIDNTANLTYTSLPGTQGTGNATPGASGDTDGERNGDGGTNDYADSDAASFTVGATYNAEKSIISTSENHTDDSSLPNTGATNVPVSVGELVRYQLETQIAEGTMVDFTLTDQLPIDGGTAVVVPLLDENFEVTVSGAQSGTFTSATYGTSLEAANGGTVDLFDNAGTPQFAGLVTYTSATNNLQLNFGNLTNSDGDSGTESLVVRFNALVVNVSEVNSGETYTNNYTVLSDDFGGTTQTRDTSGTIGVIVQEPNVSVTKTVNQTLSNPTSTTTFDGGDTVVYDIVVSNTSGTNVTDAFDLNITDALNANLSLDSVQFVGTITGTPTDNSTTGAGGTVNVDIDQLASGESLTIRLTTTVQNSVALGQVINNTADLTHTSLPGTQGTGNATPGTSGNADGERNGDGGTNDYADNDNDTFTVGGNVNATKSIDGTSETHTADTAADTTGDPRPVAVGEIITYRLVTELPEVTSPDIVVTDTLAANIEYVTGSGRVSYSADSAVTGSGNYGNNETEPATVITPTFDNGSRELVFDIGEFVNNDNDGNAEQLIIEFEALVVDDAANTPSAQWYNEYTIDLNNDSTVEDTSNQVFAQIVQPELTLTKTRTDTGLVQIGDTVDFELTLTHSVNSTSDAFNMVITDTLPTTGMSLNSVTGGNCSGVTSGSGTGIITFSVPGLALTETSCTVQYSMVVGNDVEPDMTYTNTAVATYETIDGSDQRTLTTNSDNANFTTLANDLAISKSVTPDNVEPGGTITYTIEFSHTGFTANNIVLTDTLPAEVTVQNTDSSGDVVVNNTVSNTTTEVFEIAQMTNGQTGIITLTAQLDNNLSAGTFFTNDVDVTSTEADANTANNSASDTGVTVSNVAPVLAPIGNQTIAETNTLTFTASATDNNGDTLTYGLSGEPSGANIDSGSGLFSWTPTNAQGPGIYTFTVIVSDTAPLTDSEEIVVTVTDLDIDYSVDVDPTSLIEGNTGTQPFTFTITRSGAINFASQVDYSFGGTSTSVEDYTAPTGPVSFTSGEISQTVTANVLGDWIVEPDETLSLTLFDGTAPSGGLVSYTTQAITSTIVNDDSAGINVISDTMPLTITEPAETTTFTLTLTSQPTATVSIDITNADPSKCTVSTSSVELDSSNWQTGVEVSVTAEDDDLTDGTQSCAITTAPATSSDSNYDGLDPEDVAVNVLDDDTPGVRVSPVSGDTSEAGDTASFTMQLQTQPTGPVTITLQSSDLTEGQIDLSEVVFTDATWNISQTVVITGIDDLMDDGDQSYIIETGNTQSNAALYDNLPVDDVTVVNLDDDTAGVAVSADDLLLSEPDGSEVITITLTSQPTSTVIIDLTSSDTSVCTVDPATIVFDPADWSEPISVTVQVVDDDEPRGEQNCVISGAVSSDDSVFDALPDVQIDVTVEDDESPYVYLPLIQSVSMPDLVITDLQATSDSVQVTIRNDGTAPITEGFWVDLYVNPSRIPEYNDLWQHIAEAGVVWAIANNDLPIEPGESRVLTLENATQTFNGQTVSSSPPFPTNVPVYAQIDSVSATTDFGGVQESDESNNMFGPVVSTNSTTAGSSTSSTGQPLIDFLGALPKR
ncbi:MAG: putative Ig domain-containing protein, partial [Chloroflexota bacterium]